MRKPKVGSCAALSGFALGSLAMSIAQVTAAQQDEQVDEIIIYGTQHPGDAYSGSRLDLTVLQTPATVDVIDGNAIRDRVDLSAMEAVTRSAGFTAEMNPGNGHSSIVARGFAGSNAVTKLYDGIQIYTIASVATFPQDTWSIDRIEVLKGPSAVLYGQGGIGGAMNIIPRRPQFDSSSEIRVLVGENNSSFVGVDFTGPLSDTVAYRVDFSKDTSDGYVTNGASDNEHLSLALLWQPSDEFSVNARYDSSDVSPAAYFGSLVSDGSFIEEFAFTNFNVADAVNRYEDRSLRVRADWNITDTAGLQVELYRMESDRWWRNAEYYQYFEDEGAVLRTDPLILGQDVRQTGLRTSFSFAPTATIQSVVGFEFNDLSFARPTNWGPGNPNPIDWWNFAGSIAASTGDFDTVDPNNFDPGSLSNITSALTPMLDNWSELDQWAVFGEARFALTDRVALVGALRYEDLSTHYQRAQGAFSVRGNADSLTGRLGLVYDLNDETAIYGQYGTGAEHPSNSVVTISGVHREADMIESEQFEIGIKNALPGTGLQWSVALFDITKNNLVISDPDSANPDDVIVINEQTSRGIEAGMNFMFTNQLQVHANFVTLSAKTDTGATPTGVPERTWNAGVAWRATDRFRIVADARYVDARPRGSVSLPSYTVLDASAHWRVNDRLNLILRGDNLTDELYAAGSYWSGTWLVGKPRTFSVAADLRF